MRRPSNIITALGEDNEGRHAAAGSKVSDAKGRIEERALGRKGFGRGCV